MHIDIECGFTEGLNYLIHKNKKFCGNLGSIKYQKSVLKYRKDLLNKWFNFFPGIHNHILSSVFTECRSYEYECKSEFFCLLLDINKSLIYNKYDLKLKLENIFNNILRSENSDVYSILLFLILLQNVKSINNEVTVNLNELRIYESELNNLNNDADHNFVNDYQCFMFSGSSLSQISREGESNRFDMDIKLGFIPDLSEMCSIKRSTFFSSSSGYLSNSENEYTCDGNTNIQETITNLSVVSYPFSEFSNKVAQVKDYWGEEFMDEWNAFQQGKELPRRFIWEERECNVGAEKPRMTEWHCPLSIGNAALCLALYDWRFNGGCNQEIMNAYAVPISEWIDDLIMLRLGLTTSTFKWNSNDKSFYLAVKPPKYLLQLFEPHLKAGTIFARLNLLIDGKSGFKSSVIRDGVINRLSDIIAIHREVLSTIQNVFSSILEFSIILQNMTNQMEYLGDLFEVSPNIAQCWPDHLPNTAYTKRGGLYLLKHFYKITMNMVLNEYFYLTFYILEGGLNEILDHLQNWIYKGQLIQEFSFQNVNDFIILSKENCFDVKGESWWETQFYLSEEIMESKTNWIFDELSVEILRCGKSIKLLSLIENSHGLLYNSTIIKNRPQLKIQYDIDSNLVKKIVERYVEVTKSNAADAMKFQKELIEEKRRKSQLLKQEAQKARDNYLNLQQEKIKQQNIKNYNSKLLELDRLKKEAVAEKERKLQSILEEKRVDKLLLENNEIQNRQEEELKYELTNFYAKKIAEAEARGKMALERIKISKMLINKRNIKENINQILETNEELSTNTSDMKYDDSDKPNISDSEKSFLNKGKVISNFVNEQKFSLSNEIFSKNNELQYPTHTQTDPPINALTNVEQDLSEEFIIDEANIDNPLSKTKDTVKVLMYPGNNLISQVDQKHISHFQQINVYGHTSDSTVEKALYPPVQKQKSDNNEDMKNDSYRKVNIFGHTADSTVQEILYPESDITKENIEQLRSKSITSKNRRTLKSESLKEQIHLENFRNINTKGHVSQSSVQELMYPLRKECSIYGEMTGSEKLIDNDFATDLKKTVDSFSIIQDDENCEGLSKTQKELLRISKLLSGSINHSAKLRDDSTKLTSYQVYSNDVFCKLDRSKFSFLPNPDEFEHSDNGYINIDAEQIDTIINKSLRPIILAQIKLVDSALMFSLLTTHKLRYHLKEMRRFLFLKDGKFSSNFLSKMFEFIKNSPQSMENNFRNEKRILIDILNSAVSYANESKENLLNNNAVHWTSNCKKNDLLVKFNNQLDDFCISYQICWPINIVIQQRQVWQYQSIFRAIVQIKYASWCLQQTRQTIKSWGSNFKNDHVTGVDLGFRSIHSCLMEMEHWVRSMDYIFCNQISGSGVHSWKNLIRDLNNGKITNMDSLIESHGQYLDAIVLKCVLVGDRTEWSTIPESVRKIRENIRKMIIDLLGTCFLFYRLVSLNRWKNVDVLKSKNWENNEKILQLIKNLHRKFRTYTDCLLKILKGASHDSYLKHLFVSLNYNRFYYQPTLV